MAQSVVEVKVDISVLQRKMAEYGKELQTDTLLRVIGERHVSWMVENLEGEGSLVGGWKPMADNTRAARGSGAKLLQDKGLLRRFAYQVQGNVVIAGTQAPYASFHNEGTRPYTIRPRYKRALAFMTVGGMVVVKSVQHPGLPQRRLVPTEGESEKMSVGIIEAKIAQIESRYQGGM